MSLALAMLVKNIEKNILHISNLIDWNVYDEVIIVDNGSTDNSVFLLEKLGCKVISCTNKLLDECRNLYIEHSTADWILVLDSDEYISPQEVSRLMHKPLDKYDAVKLKRYDYYGNGLWSESNLYRLFRRNSYIRYTISPIHASISASVRSSIFFPDIIIHHLDVFFNSIHLKNERYLSLIEERLQTDIAPQEKMYLLAFHALEQYISNTDTAIVSLHRALKINDHPFPHFLLAKCHLTNGDSSSASRHAAILIKSSNKIYQERGHYILAETAWQSGDIVTAKNHIKESLAISNASLCMQINMHLVSNEYLIHLPEPIAEFFKSNQYIFSPISYRSKYELSSLFLSGSTFYHHVFSRGDSSYV